MSTLLLEFVLLMLDECHLCFQAADHVSKQAWLNQAMKVGIPLKAAPHFVCLRGAGPDAEVLLTVRKRLHPGQG